MARKNEGLVDKAAEIKFARGSCSTHNSSLGFTTLKG